MKNIWLKDDEYYKLTPLTDEAVENAEEKLKVKLPKSYIKLLKEQNGGSINYNSFPSSVPTSWANTRIHVNHIFGIGDEHSILNSEYLIGEWGLPQNIVIFYGDGHSWIAFDYRITKENPPIIYIDEDSEKIIELASDFNSFLNWTYDELKTAFATNNEQEVIPALDYLYLNTKGNEHFIEKSMIFLLQNPILEIKQLAANYAYEFNETGVLSSKGIKEIISIIKSDSEIEDYADIYFRDN
jgi:hypothetical protein